MSNLNKFHQNIDLLTIAHMIHFRLCVETFGMLLEGWGEPIGNALARDVVAETANLRIAQWYQPISIVHDESVLTKKTQLQHRFFSHSDQKANELQ